MYQAHRTRLSAVGLCAWLLVGAGCAAPEGMTPVPMPVPGPAGPEGPGGRDGQLRIYGDGSAGERVVVGEETLGDENLQYGDFTVRAGATLFLPSGLVLRCSGVFTNHGTIVVQDGVLGGYAAARGGTLLPLLRPAEAGCARAAADNGEGGDASQGRLGGLGGVGLSSPLQGRTLLVPGLRGGGGGGGGSAFGGVLAPGGAGGGTLVILAYGGLVISGTFVASGAEGAAGAGGGGGGILVLASPTSIENRGILVARGGRGGASTSSGGSGGGGGGGLIHLISPRIALEGAVSVDGGEAGAQGGAGSISGAQRQGGGGGGASAGAGGGGGGITQGAIGSPLPAQAGALGLSLRTAVAPTALF